MMHKILTAALSATALAGAAAAPVFAQDPAQAGAEAGAAETFTLTDAQVTAFVEAANGINALVQDIQPRMQAAESQEAQAQIQQEAQAEMETIVQDAGLTVVEYNSIANAARTDQSVAARIQAEAQAQAGN
ncbi:DUF4168 domain-containing protein [Maricaulis sp.]|jgi:hypothetical protein|uniref:DUF4168 domain-containing protein n=1 Tax=Maricaulis sp. TaxID=1486257 RepID=UPI001B0B3411|nr:DUF4168 domain-containing protein [Maricaulis sp.]MBO6766451.1 DUF4168 domain-containing protein [Maricaulis sp.]